MSGSFLTGPPREANQGGKEGDFPLHCTLYPLPCTLRLFYLT